MMTIEQIEELESQLKVLRKQGNRVQLLAFRGVLHAGKSSLFRIDKGAGTYRLLYWETGSPTPALSDSGVDCLFRAEIPSQIDDFGSLPELGAIRSLSPYVDEVLLGERDFPRLLRFEEIAKKEMKNLCILRGGIARDIDLLPFGRDTENMPAIERFQARFVPQALKMASDLWHSRSESLEYIRSMTEENLEKSQGLEIERVEFLPDFSGQRLCVQARAGRTLIQDNVFLRNANG